MQALDPEGNYSDQEVVDALTGRYGTRRMGYRYDRLDEHNTFIEPIDWVRSASIANNTLADIKRTARFSIVDRTPINFLRDRIQPWARLEMPDGSPGFVEWPLGVFLPSTPDRQIDVAGLVVRDVEAYDQLVVLRDDKAEARYSVDTGELYTDAIGALVATVSGMVAAITPSTLTLPAVMEWEPGTPKLRILNDLLDRINYGSAWFDEWGTLICRPYQSPAELPVEYVYRDGQASVRTGGATQTLDLFDVPNKWLVVKSEPDQPPLTSVYTNDSPSSPTSTVNRGRVILDVRTEDDAADQATLDAKAARYAFEASQIYEAIDFTTLIMPMHSNGDVLGLDLPGLAVDAKYGEQGWSYNLEVGATMSHKVRRVVSI